MPVHLEGWCGCAAISCTAASHTPYPYQRCYCSICRKSAGGGGYAINIMGVADTLKVQGKRGLGVWNAPIDGHKGSADRHYCKRCGTPLWVSDEQWPELVHPLASVIDTELPKAPSSVHLLLRDKASWVEPQSGPNDDCFEGYPKLSIEDWHKKHGLDQVIFSIHSQRLRQVTLRPYLQLCVAIPVLEVPEGAVPAAQCRPQLLGNCRHLGAAYNRDHHTVFHYHIVHRNKERRPLDRIKFT